MQQPISLTRINRPMRAGGLGEYVTPPSGLVVLHKSLGPRSLSNNGPYDPEKSMDGMDGIDLNPGRLAVFRVHPSCPLRPSGPFLA